jgi:hypothetical protein
MNGETWRNIFPTLTDDELRNASENLDAYLELAWEIFEEITAKERGDLTEIGSSSTIQ